MLESTYQSRLSAARHCVTRGEGEFGVDERDKTAGHHEHDHRRMSIYDTREDLPDGLASTPDDSPSGRHYLYKVREILIAAADRPLLEKEGRLGGYRRMPTSDKPDGFDRDAPEVLGVERYTYDSEADVPSEVDRLGAPLKDEKGVLRFPRVTPNIVVGIQLHGDYGPAEPPEPAGQVSRPPRRRFLPLPGHGVKVGVIDTGFSPADAGWFNGQCQGDPEQLPQPGGEIRREVGHGTFIAGTILQRAPGAEIVVRTMAGKAGLVTDTALSHAISELGEQKLDILNLSLGGYTHEGTGLPATEAAIKALRASQPGLVVVAASGNDRVSLPFYPAAMKTVIAVGAIASATDHSRAEFSNFGPWVDACAPGVDLHSTFVPHATFGSGFVKWSGTSFATPSVVAAIANRFSPGGWRQFLWLLRPRTARQAAYELVNDAALPYVPDLGTVVPTAVAV